MSILLLHEGDRVGSPHLVVPNRGIPTGWEFFESKPGLLSGSKTDDNYCRSLYRRYPRSITEAELILVKPASIVANILSLYIHGSTRIIAESTTIDAVVDLGYLKSVGLGEFGFDPSDIETLNRMTQVALSVFYIVTDSGSKKLALHREDTMSRCTRGPMSQDLSQGILGMGGV